ncbi:hypothetical protein H5410_064386 [Solanum commersonii]|uniref:Uncharacterized protein n=1 Tax=Solanum commersonii TaxID=4109 RepID=A0A9J5W087_SOLCO|nr:hypothetical protein H5410_064386 [Solanum commersonii]
MYKPSGRSIISIVPRRMQLDMLLPFISSFQDLQIGGQCFLREAIVIIAALYTVGQSELPSSSFVDVWISLDKD